MHPFSFSTGGTINLILTAGAILPRQLTLTAACVFVLSLVAVYCILTLMLLHTVSVIGM